MMDIYLPLLSYGDPEGETVVPAPGADKDLSGTKLDVQLDNGQAHVVAQSAISASLGHGSATDASSDAPAATAVGPPPDVLAKNPPKSSGTQNPNPAPESSCEYSSYSTSTTSAAGSSSTVGTPAIRRTANASTMSATAGSPSPSPSCSSSVPQESTTCSPAFPAIASAVGEVASTLLSVAPVTLSASSVGASRQAVANDAKNEKAKEEEVPPLDSLDDFEARRRRAVFTAMLLLLEHGARDAEHLSHLVAAMSGEELQQVAEERALAGRCGNPLCNAVHSVAWSPPPRRRWDPSAGFVEPPPPSHFCSASCELLIESYASQLGDSPLERLQPGVREMLAVSHAPRRPGLENVAAQGGGVPTMMAEVRERDPTAAVAEAVAGGRELERLAAAGSTDGGGDGGSSGAVEGYIPRAGRSRKPPLPPPPATAVPAPSLPPPSNQPQFSPGSTPPNLKPSLRKQSSLKVSKKGAGTEGRAATSAAAVTSVAVPFKREPKRVTFGPKIEYQIPAQPSRRPASASSQTPLRTTEQPVLLFDVDEDAADAGGGGGGAKARARGQRVPRQRDAVEAGEAEAGALQGTLRVAEAAEVVQEAAAGAEAEAGWPKGLTDEELAASMQERVAPSAVPRAMKLWFPPAAGGTGIGRRSGGGAAQRQRQRSKLTVQAAGAPLPLSDDPAATAATSTTTTTTTMSPSSREDRTLATADPESTVPASSFSVVATGPQLTQ
ncbi:hypothetical protein Vafri_12095, partial [Volvox africanus]